MSTIERQCPNGHPVGEATTFCPICGMRLDGSTPAAPAQRVCVNGHAIATGNQFCSQCGATEVGTPAVAAAQFAPPTYGPAPTSFPPPPPPGYGPPGAPAGYGAPGAPAYGQPYAPQYVYVAARPMCGQAIAAFVLSLVWFYWVTTIIGFILGLVALRQIKQQDLRGRGFALAAVIISSVLLGGLVILLVVIFIVAGVHANSNESLAHLHRQLATLR